MCLGVAKVPYLPPVAALDLGGTIRLRHQLRAHVCTAASSEAAINDRSQRAVAQRVLL